MPATQVSSDTTAHQDVKRTRSLSKSIKSLFGGGSNASASATNASDFSSSGVSSPMNNKDELKVKRNMSLNRPNLKVNTNETGAREDKSGAKSGANSARPSRQGSVASVAKSNPVSKQGSPKTSRQGSVVSVRDVPMNHIDSFMTASENTNGVSAEAPKDNSNNNNNDNNNNNNDVRSTNSTSSSNSSTSSSSSSSSSSSGSSLSSSNDFSVANPRPVKPGNIVAAQTLLTGKHMNQQDVENIKETAKEKTKEGNPKSNASSEMLFMKNSPDSPRNGTPVRRRRGNSNASALSQENGTNYYHYNHTHTPQQMQTLSSNNNATPPPSTLHGPRRSNTISSNAFYPHHPSQENVSANNNLGPNNSSSTSVNNSNNASQLMLNQIQNQPVIYKSDSFVLFKNFMHEHHLTVVPLVTISSTAKSAATSTVSPTNSNIPAQNTTLQNTSGDPSKLEKINSNGSLNKMDKTSIAPNEQQDSHQPVPQSHQNIKLPKNTSFSITSLFKVHKNDSHMGLPGLGNSSANSSDPNHQQQQQQQLEQQHQEQFQYHSSSWYSLTKKEVCGNNKFNTNIKYAKSLINSESSYRRPGTNANSFSSSSSSSSGGPPPGVKNPQTPNIVNNKAAISEEELNLINDLTIKMKNSIKKDSISNKNNYNKNNTNTNTNTKSPLGKNEETKSEYTVDNIFFKKYGLCIGTLGQGAYGVVKVTSKKLISSKPTMAQLDINCKKTFRYKDSAFFAIKELRPLTTKHLTPDGDELDEDESQEASDSTSVSASANKNSNTDNDNTAGKTAADYDEKFCTRLTSEFVIGHALNHVGRHPNILKVLDLFTFTNMPNKFIQVMEFCPSGDLYSLLKSHPNKLHPLEIDCFIKQLINGVSFMHEHGVAHCDLKPENLLFKPNGILKISDFGTACVFQTAWEKKCHLQTGCMGSEPYMAPEQFIPRKQYDPRLVDTWSIGMIYMAMCLGHYLWKSPLKDKDENYNEYLESIDYFKQGKHDTENDNDKKNSTDSLTDMNASVKSGQDDFGDYSVFENLKHVNSEIKLARKACLYKMFSPSPARENPGTGLAVHNMDEKDPLLCGLQKHILMTRLQLDNF
ncbi:hypothetical protein ACO0QE_002130 [Hanseniaspora vineae]